MNDTRSAAPRPAGALCSALLLAAACAAATAARRQAGVLSAGAFTPARPPAASYGPDPSRACPEGSVYGLLADELGRAQEAGKPAPQAEGRLCALAEALLGWEEKESPPESVLAFLSSYFGLPAPVYRMVLTSVETEDAKEIAPRLVEPVANFSRGAAQPRYGLATLRLKKGTTRLALVLQDAAIELDPLPRQLAPGARTTLSGRFLDAVQNARLLTCDAFGKLETKPIPAGNAFRADLRCSEKPGVLRVEIRGDRKGGSSAVASLPVACGSDLPASVPVRAEKATGDVAAGERKILELVNAERNQGGLSQLSWDEAVAKVARDIAESERDEAKRGSAAAGPSVVERLKKAGASSLLILQNPAQAHTAEEAHLRFSRSPVHRCNYLNAEITDAGVGVGVAVAPEAEGRSSAFVTELFVKQLPAIDVASAREKLRAAVARKRSDARAPALAADPALDRVAAEYAKLLASTDGSPPKDKADEIARPLYRAYRTVNFISGVKGDPEELAEEPGITGNGKLVGVGVAQGPHPSFGKNAVYATILIATPR